MQLKYLFSTHVNKAQKIAQPCPDCDCVPQGKKLPDGEDLKMEKAPAGVGQGDGLTSELVDRTRLHEELSRLCDDIVLGVPWRVPIVVAVVEHEFGCTLW